MIAPSDIVRAQNDYWLPLMLAIIGTGCIVSGACQIFEVRAARVENYKCRRDVPDL